MRSIRYHDLLVSQTIIIYLYQSSLPSSIVLLAHLCKVTFIIVFVH